MATWRTLIRRRNKAKENLRALQQSGAEDFNEDEILNYHLIKEMEFLDDDTLQIRETNDNIPLQSTLNSAADPPDFTPSPIEVAVRSNLIDIPSTSGARSNLIDMPSTSVARSPLNELPTPAATRAPYNGFRSRLVSKRAREAEKFSMPKAKKAKQAIETDSDDEDRLISLITDTHKQNLKHKDAKAVASMVETFLIDNQNLVGKFRVEVCKLILKFEQEKNDNE